jgi:hypothetical protein
MSIHSNPRPSYKNAVVLYHWRLCSICKIFMPTWAKIREELREYNIDVWEIEVQDKKRKLEKLGVSLGNGVPRIVFYNKKGEGVVHKGARSESAVVAAAVQHIISFADDVPVHGSPSFVPATTHGDATPRVNPSFVPATTHGDAMPRVSPSFVPATTHGDSMPRVSPSFVPATTHGDSMPRVSPSFVSDNLPATVLYFRDTCGFCTRFKPTFVEFAAGDGVGTVVSVDVLEHPTAMGDLHPDARSPTVPHVVYHAADGTQVPFYGERTVHELRKFVKSMISNRHMVSFDGGVTMPSARSAETRLTQALDNLQSRAAYTLGKNYHRAFEPENATVVFVGIMHEKNEPLRDRVYILLAPIQQPQGKPTAYAAVYGYRTGELDVKIYVNRDVDALLLRKQEAGFTPVMETDPHVAALNMFGYHVGLS